MFAVVTKLYNLLLIKFKLQWKTINLFFISIATLCHPHSRAPRQWRNVKFPLKPRPFVKSRPLAAKVPPTWSSPWSPAHLRQKLLPLGGLRAGPLCYSSPSCCSGVIRCYVVTWLTNTTRRGALRRKMIVYVCC